MRILVTAGPTREYLDTVRYLSNASSGRFGFAIAAAAARRGHAVTLIHGPVELRPPAGVRAVAVESAREMLRACRASWPGHDALVMAAAVADYTPAAPLRRKLRKRATVLTVRLRPTVDILAELARRRRGARVVVGFALEDRDARRRAARKLRDKHLDAIVLNAPPNIGSRRAAVEVLERGGSWQVWPAGSKSRVAGRLVRLVERLAAGRGPSLASTRGRS